MASRNDVAGAGDGDWDGAPHAQEPPKDELRRARKRATDRRSQRQHRERQRAHIRQLEETVERFRAGFSESGGGENAALLRENERLAERCRALEATLLRIGGLANAAGEGDGAGADGRGAETEAQRMTPLAESASSSSWQRPPTPCGSSVLPVDQEPQQTAEAAIMDMSDAMPSMDLDFLDLTECMPTPPRNDAEACGLYVAQADGRASDGPAVEATRNSDVNEPGGLQGCPGHRAPNPPVTMAVGRGLLSPLVAHPDPLLDPQIQSAPWDSLPAHLAFPSVSADLGRWDMIIVKMINEARLQYQRGQLSPDEPSLKTVLSSKSTDALASCLFHHICSFGAVPLHLLLSIFWVQYLLLRWYVFRTHAAFLRIPDFLRPTELEKRLPHRPCIGMLVWPDVRRTLVRDSLFADPEYIGMELMSHMSSKWVPTSCVTGDLIGSTDVYAIIEHQACKPESWKVDSSFKEKHRQFANCRLG